MTDRYSHVLSPIKLGPVELKNRFYFSTHGNPYVSGSGPSDAFAQYYGARAAGGCALSFHSLSVMPGRGGLGVTPYLEESMPSFQAVAEVVHDNGGKIFGDVHYTRVNNEWAYEPGSPRAPLFAPSPLQMFDD